MEASTLSARDRQILAAIVEEYVQTAEPVGSRHLTKKYRLGVSPATVRNVMADLEELGFLAQPHTSAGRKPTDRGYRYYVDSLMQTSPPSSGERRRLRRTIAASKTGDVEEMLETTSRTLSALARQVGVVVAPRLESSVFRHIDFVWLRPSRVLVVLVSRSGAVYHRPVEAPEVGSQAELDKMANYLNGVLHDLPLWEVREKILSEMATERAVYDSLLRRALQLGRRALEENPQKGDVFVGDPSALLEQPEFSDVSRMRGIFEAFEKKGLVLKLLDRAFEGPGLQVSIGQENPVADFRDCSLVSATYSREGRVLGTLGVIGPTRMPYSRVAGLVEYTARLLGEVFETL
ncbi:MAG: heat-inducible transcriptional repressor HrcA [Deferrisomatales bacterium]